MASTSHPIRLPAQVPDLEKPLSSVETQLQALAAALQGQDLGSVDEAAASLHQALSAAIDHFSRAARAGNVPAHLRERLVLAGGQVAAQREALARATASLDRAIDVLLPRPAAGTPNLYSSLGAANQRSGRGSLLA